MTRTCVICQEKNYKNSASFFSAPKDAKIRKLWQDAINIQGYKVTDETYICSKHFDKDDIITHWVSGIPPNVISIEYKKYRLRPGAIPKPLISNKLPLNVKRHYSNNIVCKSVHKVLSDDKYEKLLKKRIRNKGQFKRKDSDILKENVNIEKQMCSKPQQNIYSVIEHNRRTDIVFVDEDCDVDIENKSDNNTTDIQMPNDITQFPSKNIFNCQSKESQNRKIVIKPWIKYLHDSKSKEESTTADSLDIFDSSNKQNSCKYNDDKSYKNFDFEEKDHDECDDPNEHIILERHGYDELVDHEELIGDEGGYNEQNTCDENELNNEQITESLKNNLINNARLKETGCTLFEDFLDTYSEAVLPPHWSSRVIMKEQSIMVIYSCLNVTLNGLPYAEKQVFVNTNMYIRCTVMKKEIDPFMYNLVEDYENLVIRSLTDLEDFIESFSQAAICSGCPLKSYTTTNFVKAFMDGESVHHVKCSLLINHEMSLCSKCFSLGIFTSKNN